MVYNMFHMILKKHVTSFSPFVDVPRLEATWWSKIANPHEFAFKNKSKQVLGTNVC